MHTVRMKKPFFDKKKSLFQIAHDIVLKTVELHGVQLLPSTD